MRHRFPNDRDYTCGNIYLPQWKLDMEEIGWHIVFNHTQRWFLISELEPYLNENFSGRWHAWNSNWIAFEDADDAILFKLGLDERRPNRSV